MNLALLKKQFQLLSSNKTAMVAGEVLFVKFLIMGLAFALNIFITRLLGPEGRGEVFLLLSITLTIVQFGTFGIDYVNNYGVAKKRERLVPFFNNTLVLIGFFAPLSWSIIALYLALTHQDFGFDIIHLFLMALPIPFFLLTHFFGALLLGLQAQRQYNVAEISGHVLQFVYLAILITFGTVSVPSVLLVFLLGPTTIFLLQSLFLTRKHGCRIAKPNFGEWFSLFRYGIQQYVEQFLAFIIFRVDVFIVTALLGITATGHYSVGITWATLLMMVPQAIGRVLFPKLAGSGDYAHSRTITNKAAFYTGILMFGVCSIIGASSFIFIPTLYGEAFTPSIYGLLALLPGIWAWSVESVIRKLIVAYNYKLIVLFGWVFAVCINVGLNFLLIPIYGIAGAGMALSASMVFLLFYTLYLYSIHTDDPTRL